MGADKKSPKKGKRKKKAIASHGDVGKGAAGRSTEISDHKHCYNCGRAISSDKDICSEECQQEWDRMLRKKKLITYLPVIGGVLLLLFYILVMSQGG
ncbi:MAG: DUF2116 family Zn-ribbon domain-containing protein [Thermoplasmatota archaeon]